VLAGLKREVPVWVAVLLMVLAICVTAYALTIRALQIEKINVWGGQIQDTNFDVTGIDTKFKGPNKVEVTLTLKNLDTAAHSATVTLQLLDSNGNVIVEDTQQTGNVAGGAEWTYTFSFTQPSLVSAYDRPFLQVKQLS
jgi:hypothetical protein